MQGFPRSPRGRRAAIVRGPWLAIACVVASGAIALMALTTALWAIPIAGAEGVEGGTIEVVLPGGPGWRAGIRVGQPYISVDPGERQEDWTITVDQGMVTTIAKQTMIDELRATVPIAGVATLAALLALLVVALSPSAAIALAAGAIVLSEHSLMASGLPAPSTVVAAVGIVAPSLWFLARSGRSLLPVVAVAAVGLLALAWMAVRLLWPAAFEPIEVTRVVVTYGSLVALVVVAGIHEVGAVAGGYDRRRRTDLIILAVTCIAVVLLVDSGAPVVPTIVAGLAALLVYPLVRGRLWQTIDRLAVGELRERATVRATEDERRRLSRDIHDTAIQDLAALASSLERGVDAEGAATSAETLRAVTDRLRGITNELSSAELEDLGLGGALAALVSRSNQPGAMRVEADLRDGSASPTGVRLPDDVALAMFRIVQEAIRNAQRHSGGTLVTVSGSIDARSVSLTIEDDGVGIDDVAARSAAARGHMGISSMRQRAALVDASLSITSAEPGTRVRVWWSR